MGTNESKEQSNTKSKEIYFIVVKPGEEKTNNKDIKFFSKDVPQLIFNKVIKRNDRTYIELIVFKLNLKEIKIPQVSFKLEYEIEDYNYTILLTVKENYFIHNVKLKQSYKYFKELGEKDIDQNIIPIYIKLKIFLEALEENNEKDKIEKLFTEIIELYNIKKNINFLLCLFIHIHDNKDLCNKLLMTFSNASEIGDTERDIDLRIYLNTYNKIYLNADNIIKKNDYEAVSFYGIILIYFNYFDTNDIFAEKINKFHQKYAFILYKILIKFKSYFINNITNDIKFYYDFFGYIIRIKNEKIFLKILDYIKDIETFLYIINQYKDQISKIFHKLIPIKIKNELKIIKKERNKDIDNIIDSLEEIIDYSNNKEKLLVYFPSKFWIYLLNKYNKWNLQYIDNCYKLRIIFKKYYNSITQLIKDINQDNYNQIFISDIKQYYEKDEFAYILNKNIFDYIKNNKNKLSNEEIITIITQFNPYFNYLDNNDDEEKYSQKRDISFLDFINFDNIDEQFIPIFKQSNFLLIFKKNISEFLTKLTSKIKNISDLNTVIELIDVNQIKDHINDYYSLLKDKYELFIKKEIEAIKNKEELNKAIKILANFIIKIYLQEKNYNFLEERISKLDCNIKALIYKELLTTFKGNKYKSIKEYIYNIFLKDLNNFDTLMKLINIFDQEERKNFIKELIERCLFTKNEFYSKNETIKIKLLCELNEKEMIQIDFDRYYSLEETLIDILKDLENGLLSKNKLEEFLGKNEQRAKKEKIIKKLGLIKIVLNEFNPEKKYNELNNIIEEMDNIIKKLNFIKNSLFVFHKYIYQFQLQKIIDILNDINHISIKKFKSKKMQEDISDLFKFESLCQKINEVKDLLFFKILNKNALGKDEEERFINAKAQLDKIRKSFVDNNNIEEIYSQNDKFFDSIKDELNKREDNIAKKFVEQLINYFDLSEKKYLEDLIILLKSKKYENDLKGINYFFSIVKSKELNLPINIELSKMNIKEIKDILKQLKKDKIYDYQSDNHYYKFFTAFYEKEEAIDFLLSKKDGNFDYLKDKLYPNNIRITIKNIDEINDCLYHFNKIIKLEEGQLIEYIKNLDQDVINKFINYTNIYQEIIKLDRDDDILYITNFNKINKIIQEANFTITIDNDDFYYKEIDENIKINIDDLIYLIKQMNIISHENKENNNKKNLLEKKFDKFVFFKNLINNLEIIYDEIKILRIKGCNLPISINIEVHYPKIKYYYLNYKEISFDDIKGFIFKAKNDYKKQINIIILKEKYLRFLYGKLFRKIQLHLEHKCDIEGIIRYILNITDNSYLIQNGNINNTILSEDYISEYKEYNRNSFNNISTYIQSLFHNNNLDLEKHYNKILIKEKNKYKGIYLTYCKNISMEEYILFLFSDKLGLFPIAQNILICGEETYFEEIKSFLYRAILCEYNTLFIVEINESFSINQICKMNIYIENLLFYLYEKCKKEKKLVDKLNTQTYLKSCVVFIYDKNLKEKISYLKEIEKYSIRNNSLDEGKNVINISEDISCQLGNLKIISSDICGLGKSYKIKKTIKEQNKKYYHFPLGGKLTKKIIYEKLLNLFETIKRDENNKDNNNTIIDYKNISVHIDLMESKETYLVNEFLLSFIFTKFYLNQGDIIYIPKDLNIYIEIPNCFDDYLTKIKILNVFNIENIVLGEVKKSKQKNITSIKMSALELEPEIKNIFKRLIGKETNEEIEEFIKNNLGVKEYSYHQVQIFIKIFISQFRMLENVIKIIDSDKNDDTEKCIQYLAESSKYFINGGFPKILMKKNCKNQGIDESNGYENDLAKMEFKTPLVFVNEETKKVDLLYFNDKTKEDIKK